MRIVEIREVTQPIASPIRNAYIDFSKMTTSLVAVVTDVVRDGRRVVGYGFNSNGRYGQGGLIRERFRDRILEADPKGLLDDARDNIDPAKVWAAMMSNEKPGATTAMNTRSSSTASTVTKSSKRTACFTPSTSSQTKIAYATMPTAALGIHSNWK